MIAFDDRGSDTVSLITGSLADPGKAVQGSPLHGMCQRLQARHLPENAGQIDRKLEAALKSLTTWHPWVLMQVPAAAALVWKLL